MLNCSGSAVEQPANAHLLRGRPVQLTCLTPVKSGCRNFVTNPERGQAVGYKFSLVLSREISDDESLILKDAGCTSAVFGIDSLPTNADITVTKMDFDDAESPSLADAIE